MEALLASKGMDFSDVKAFDVDAYKQEQYDILATVSAPRWIWICLQDFKWRGIKMKKNDLGLVHIYCGEGKGKTTCSVGLTVRAAGYGLRVLFMQFLKSGDSSELKVLRSLDNVEVVGMKPVKKFSFQMTEEEKEETRISNAEQFADVVKRLETEHFDMLVLDETLGAIEAGLLDEDVIAGFRRAGRSSWKWS